MYDDDDYDDDDYNNYDDYSDYLDSQKPNAKSLPLIEKGQEIQQVVFLLTSLFPEDNMELQSLKGEMLHDAALLTVKIAGAEATDLYDLKMEAATFIRKAACDLKVMNHSLDMVDFKDAGYFQIVRDLIEEYRLLFIDWVAGFDQWSYITDRWGLFNPPGISPFDEY
jgi:hypothetical protein